jgi:hypothetical protein
MNLLRRIFLFILLLGTLVGSLPVEISAKKGTADDVVVKRLELQLPNDSTTQDGGLSTREEFLWKHFFSQADGPSFTHITTKDWRPKAREFHDALVAKAKKLNLPYAALDKSIQTAIASPVNEKLAVIPIGAYLIRDADKDAWVIVCNWEDDYSGQKLAAPSLVGQALKPAPESQDMWLPLAHRRVFVFSVEDNLWLAFTTCL